MVLFGRISTAMVTPFDKKGHVDFEKTTQLVNYLIKNGSDSLVVSGTTGESPTLSREEKLALFSHVVKVVDKRVPVIAGTGTYDTHESISLTEQATELGVDAIMAVVPYYNKPNQAGLYEHFKAIAACTHLPIMLYNIPGRSAVNMAPETIIRLAEIENIVAVKEASADLNAMAKIIANTGDDFLLYSGDDSLALPVLAIGGVGVVSVSSHVLGGEMQQMIAAFMSGDHQVAAKLHQLLLPAMASLFIAPNPTPVKTAMQFVGLDVGSVRLPLVPLTNEERSTIKTALKKIKK